MYGSITPPVMEKPTEVQPLLDRPLSTGAKIKAYLKGKAVSVQHNICSLGRTLARPFSQAGPKLSNKLSKVYQIFAAAQKGLVYGTWFGQFSGGGSGLVAGAALGTLLGGPIGGLTGAAIGAPVGFFGGMIGGGGLGLIIMGAKKAIAFNSEEKDKLKQKIREYEAQLACQKTSNPDN